MENEVHACIQSERHYVIVVYSRGWVREGDVPPPARSAKIKVTCVKTLNFRHAIDTRLPVHYDMYLLEGNIRKMLLLLN